MSAQKGGDAVRPPQTHPETRSAAITRPERRPRRIPPRRHRPKPPQARQADPGAGAARRDLTIQALTGEAATPPIRAAAITSNQTSSTESGRRRGSGHRARWLRALKADLA